MYRAMSERCGNQVCWWHRCWPSGMDRTCLSRQFNTFTHAPIVSCSHARFVKTPPSANSHALLLRAPIKKLCIYTSLFSASQVTFRLPLSVVQLPRLVKYAHPARTFWAHCCLICHSKLQRRPLSDKLTALGSDEAAKPRQAELQRPADAKTNIFSV